MRARCGLGRMQAGSLVVLLAALAVIALLAACGSAEQRATPTPTIAAAVDVPAPAPVVQVSDVVATVPSEPDRSLPTAEKPVYGGTIRLAKVITNPDPYFIANSLATWGRAFYNGLVEQQFPYDEAKGPQLTSGLATEWSKSQEGSKWTLKLRQGVTFHDGEAFNAADVVTTFERALDPGVLIAGRTTLIRQIFAGGVKKIDDYTVVLDTREPNASALPFLAYEALTMMPEHIIRGDRNATDSKLRWKFLHPNTSGTLAVGTGPFVMKKWNPEVEAIGERNSNYWGQDSHGNRLPYLDRIEYRTITDPTRLNANFVAGALSIGLGTGTGMHPKNAQYICSKTRQPDCYLSQWYPHGAFEWFANPAGVDLFKDDRVVRAAHFATDHQAIIDTVYGRGQGFMWMDRIRYPETALTVKEQYETLPWSDPARRPEFFQKTKDLIGGAGYPNGIDLPLPIFGSCSGVFLDKFSREVDQFYQAGLRATLECRQGIIQSDELKAGRWSLSDSPMSIWIVDPGVMVFSKLLLDSPAVAQAPFRYVGQETIDTKFRQILREPDPAKRNEGYRDLERYLANDKLTAWSIGYTYVVAAVHGCVRNYKPGGVWASHDMALAFAWVTPDCK